MLPLSKSAKACPYLLNIYRKVLLKNEKEKKKKRKERKKNISGGILENIPYATLDRLQAVVNLLMW